MLAILRNADCLKLTSRWKTVGMVWRLFGDGAGRKHTRGAFLSHGEAGQRATRTAIYPTNSTFCDLDHVARRRVFANSFVAGRGFAVPPWVRQWPRRRSTHTRGRGLLWQSNALGRHYRCCVDDPRRCGLGAHFGANGKRPNRNGGFASRSGLRVHFYQRALIEQRMGPQADWSVVDALMLKTLAQPRRSRDTGMPSYRRCASLATSAARWMTSASTSY
jgi:hypothetical protein